MSKKDNYKLRRFNDVLTVDDLMDFLAIGRSTAYNLLRSGQIKCIKIGRNYKIPKENVLNYVNTTQQ
jgi:excisionase family DNA binding protein